MANIVIIDDSRLSVSALQNIIPKLGHNVVGTAFDGESGVAKVRETNPEVVCLDMIMPGKDGLETAKSLRAVKPGIKIIMITQNELSPTVKSQINAVSYVLKPITQTKIADALAVI